MYLIAGGLFAGVGLASLAGAVAVTRLAFDRPAGRWLVAVIFGMGCVPYPWLFGPPAIVFNLLLLGVAVYLLAGSREPAGRHVRGPMA